MHLQNVYRSRGNLEKILKALEVYAENIQHMKMKIITENYNGIIISLFTED